MAVVGMIVFSSVALAETSNDTAADPAGDTVQDLTARVRELEAELTAARHKLTRWKETEWKLRVESALADPGGSPVAILQLPFSAGGYLEDVRTLVVSRIVSLEAAGEATLPATDLVARGDRAMEHGFYKKAYDAYALAYRTAVN
jgi:outer membrane murein-binding lipoprotein Lpp